MLVDLLFKNVKLEIVKKILAMCVIVLFASFLGYVVETIWVALRHGYIDNRGMHFPLLLGYGIANLVIYLLFGSPSNPRIAPPTTYTSSSVSSTLWYFVIIFFFISVAEAVMGYAVHFFCGVEWWNYNSLPMHIGQYTSVPTSIGFTACICIFQDKFFVPMMEYLINIDLLQYGDLILILTFVATMDCAKALLYMAKYKKVYTSFHLKLRGGSYVASITSSK